ncbi:MAG: ATP-binding protein [Spirosomataceae bacterium]
MQTLDIQVSNRLTKLYLAALTAVVILSLFGQILIQNTLGDLLDDSHVVNLAGRQRMLSQRLSKIAIILINEDRFGKESEYYRQEFASVLKLWKKCHEGLKNGRLDLEKTYYVKNSPKINEMFEVLSPYFDSMYGNMELINNKSYVESDKGYILNHILRSERSFLKNMDAIVFQYDLESTQRIDRLKGIELLLLLLTIGVLIVEVILIYRPLVEYVKEIIRQLTVSENQLQQTNVELSEINQKLIETQEDLVKATQEKFDLIRKEDNIRSASLLEGQEQERERVARELHDGIGQMLTGLKLHSEKLKSLPFENDKQRQIFAYHQNLINETIAATRNASFNLMPAVLSDFGLVAIIKLLGEQTMQSAGIEVVLNENLGTKRLPYNLEINLYRIAQEAVNNAVKYAKTKQIFVDLIKNKNSVSLIIADKGIGFDINKVQKNELGNGLKNIYTRVRLLNGSVSIESASKKGTTISVRLFIEQ